MPTNKYWLVVAALVAGCGSNGVFHGVGDGGTINHGDGFVFDFGGTVCSPSDPPSCDGSSIKICRASGSGYDYTPCSVGCANGVCTCNPGDKQCVGAQVQVCQMDGTWLTTSTCANGMQCQAGLCSDARCDDEVMSTNPHALPTNAWPRFRHDNRNTGSTPAVVADNPKLKWKTFIGGTTYGTDAGALASGPVVDQNNRIWIGGGEEDMAGGSFYSLDAGGKKVWTFAAQRGFGISNPAVRADATSFFATSADELFAVDPMGGKSWNYMVGSVADGDPVITRDGNVIYASDDGSLYALDFAGNLKWKSDPVTGPGEVDSGLAESCDGNIYAGGRGGWYQLDATTGKTNWKVPATDPYGECAPLVTADGVMYGFDSNGIGYSIDKTGKVLWMQTYGQPPGSGGFSVAKIGGLIFTVLNDGNLHAMDALTGKEQWKKPVGPSATEVNAGPVVDGKLRIYYNSPDGNLYAFDVAGNQLWKIPVSGKAIQAQWVGTMAIGNDGTIYIPGNDGTLYAFQ